jgi:predicted ATP-dependent endonuclease of OLD family
MKIESVYIKNFRCFKEDTIQFDDYTCLVGANGSGKSTVFSALHVFFRHYKDSKTDLSNLTEKDFHHKNTNEPIVIRVIFTDLSAAAQEELKDYYRQGKLIVTAKAVFNPESQKAEVKQYGNRLVMEEFRKFFEMEKNKASASELNALYNELKSEFPDLPTASSKDAKLTALREYEAARPDRCVLAESEDQFYGASRGVNRLVNHIQWVFVPASKDVTEEGEESKNSALGQLLLRTVRSKVNFSDKLLKLRTDTNDAYKKLLDDEQNALDSISVSLKDRLSQWAHPSINAAVKWKQDPEKSVRVEEPVAAIQIGERGFEAELSRFGHGLQRSYMFALLQELNTINDENAPTLILCIEEPELYQHPPQARHLASTLMDLTETNSQVMVCSHSPLFIPKNSFSNVRIVKEEGEPCYSINKQFSNEAFSQLLGSIGSKPIPTKGVVAKLYPFLSPAINEMFFCKVPIFVEGIEDIAYIKTYLDLSGLMEDFRKYGCHLVNADKKSNIIEPLAVAILMDLNPFVVFDFDTDAKEEHADRHRADNKKLITLQGHGNLNHWPDQSLSEKNFWGWKTNLGMEVQGEIQGWKKYYDIACKEFGNAAGLHKNPLAIARTLEIAWENGEQSGSLMNLIRKVLLFASGGVESDAQVLELNDTQDDTQNIA